MTTKRIKPIPTKILVGSWDNDTLRGYCEDVEQTLREIGQDYLFDNEKLKMRIKLLAIHATVLHECKRRNIL